MKPIPARLLIIEDDPSIPVLLSAWLNQHSEANLTLDHAPTMELGIDRAKGAAAILLDLTLSDNWPVAQTLSAIAGLRESAPVIVLTGYSTGDVMADAEFASDVIAEHGADAVIFKNSLLGNTKEAIGWIFLAVQAAIGRRLYQSKRAKGSI